MRQDFEENLEMDKDEFDGESNVNGNSQNEFPDDLEDAEIDVELSGAEFSALNTAMDQLQAALDTLESRNAGIHEELLQLLQSNREIRLGLSAQNEEDTDSEADEQMSRTRGDKDAVNDKLAETSSTAETEAESLGAAVEKSELRANSQGAREDSITSQLARADISTESSAPQ